MTAPRRGLDSLLADALADLANASLELDPAHRARLAALQGRRIQLTATLPAPLQARDFGLVVEAERLRFLPHAPEQPNVVARGSPPDLIAWLVGGERGAGGRLTIEGDETVLAELAAAIRAFRPDFGAPLSRLFGEELAQTALGAAELALAAARSALQGARRTVRAEAARAFVDRKQAERFLDALDDLRLRVDRLAARVQTQEQRGTSP